MDNVIDEIKKVFENGGNLPLCSKYFISGHCCCSPNIGFQRVFLLPGEKELLERENDSFWEFNNHNGFDELRCYKRGLNCNVKAVECYLYPFLPVTYCDKAEILAAFPMCPLYNDLENSVLKDHLRKVFKAGQLIEKAFPNWLQQRKGSSGYTASYCLDYSDIDKPLNSFKQVQTSLTKMEKLIKYFDNFNFFVNTVALVDVEVSFKENIELIKITDKLINADCYIVNSLDDIDKIFEHTNYVVLFQGNIPKLPYKVLVKDDFYIIVNELNDLIEYDSFLDWAESLKFDTENLPYNNNFKCTHKDDDLYIFGATIEDLTHLQHVLDFIRFNITAVGFYQYIPGWKNEVNGNLTIER